MAFADDMVVSKGMLHGLQFCNNSVFVVRDSENKEIDLCLLQ